MATEGVAGTGEEQTPRAGRRRAGGNGTLSPVSPIARLSSWFGHGPAATTARPAIEEARRASGRQLYAAIGEFLAAHDLAPTTDHFRIARSYVLGESGALIRAIDERLHSGATLDAPFLATLAMIDRTAFEPDILAMAAALAGRLAESERALRQGEASNRDYERALSTEAIALGNDPEATVARLLSVTATAIARSRQLADQLKRTHRETESLRHDLDQARRAAEEDHLTGLPNRRSFDTRLHAISADGAPAREACVAICDIDDFKAINDRLGHDTGDRVLKLVAGHLTRTLKGVAFVARHGGEEFACLFEGLSIDAAAERLDDARAALAERQLVDQTSGEGIGQLSFSAGIAPVGDCAAAAMRAADEAMYLAKRRGKNRIVTASASALPQPD